MYESSYHPTCKRCRNSLTLTLVQVDDASHASRVVNDAVGPTGHGRCRVLRALTARCPSRCRCHLTSRSYAHSREIVNVCRQGKGAAQDELLGRGSDGLPRLVVHGSNRHRWARVPMATAGVYRCHQLLSHAQCWPCSQGPSLILAAHTGAQYCLLRTLGLLAACI
jgi:hypothetical protein